MKINLSNSINSIEAQTSVNAQDSKTNAADKSFEDALNAAVKSKDTDKLKNVCKEFEGILMNMMYKQMKATVPKSDLIPEQSGREIFQSMLDDELVNQASERSSFGLAETLYKQLSRQVK